MSDIEVGKFIVYEGIFRDRFVVREVVGDSPHYWQVLDPRRADEHPHRVKKSTIGRVGVFDDGVSADSAAREIKEKLARINKKNV